MNKINEYINIILRDFLQFPEKYELVPYGNSLIIKTTSQNPQFINILKTRQDVNDAFKDNMVQAIITMDDNIIPTSIITNISYDKIVIEYKVRSLRNQQDIEYYKSLYKDIEKEYSVELDKIIKSRQSIRDQIHTELNDKINSKIEFNPKLQRLLRIPPQYRTTKDQLEIDSLKHKENICYNTNNEGREIYQFRMESVNRLFCVNIQDIIYDSETNLANVILDLPDNTEVDYPLTSDQSDEITLRLRTLELIINTDVIYRKLENIKNELRKSKITLDEVSKVTY
jgi:hypothetical protein